jgi:chromosomal replication initiation ATPase DnaA
MSCEIKLPDEILLYSFLVKYADEKKLVLTDKQCIFIIERVERNFETVIKIIDHLDRVSLEIKRKLTFDKIEDVINLINNN